MENIINNANFIYAINQVANRSQKSGAIGTLKEKTLHAAIKLYIEPDELQHEFKTPYGIVDICTKGGMMYEVQTRQLFTLNKKLPELLKNNPVTVVYPIAHEKWLSWIDMDSGEIGKQRKSPKLGSNYDSLKELYSLKKHLTHENMFVRLMLIDLTEYRLKNGWGNNGKRGSTRYERIPLKLYSDITLHKPDDYSILLPIDLSYEFTVDDLMKAAKISLTCAQRGVNLLCSIGAIKCIGKVGRRKLYSKTSLPSCDG